MKKYLKELIIAGIELALIFLFPLIPMGNKDAHIILIMALTLIIGIIGIAISDKKIKFLHTCHFPTYTNSFFHNVPDCVQDRNVKIHAQIKRHHLHFSTVHR